MASTCLLVSMPPSLCAKADIAVPACPSRSCCAACRHRQSPDTPDRRWAAPDPVCRRRHDIRRNSVCRAPPDRERPWDAARYRREWAFPAGCSRQAPAMPANANVGSALRVVIASRPRPRARASDLALQYRLAEPEACSPPSKPCSVAPPPGRQRLRTPLAKPRTTTS